MTTAATTFEDIIAEIHALPVGVTAVFVTHADSEVEIVGTFEEADQGVKAVRELIVREDLADSRGVASTEIQQRVAD